MTILMILKSVLSVIFSILAIKYFNIFSLIKFIPSEHSYEVYLTLYLSIFELIFNKILEFFKERFYGELSCVFYENNNKFDEESDANIKFNNDVCYLNCIIKIKGSSQLFKDNSIIIALPNWASVQLIDNSKMLNEKEKNKYTISLSKIVPQDKKYVDNSSMELRLGFILEEHKDRYKIKLVPELNKKKFIKFKFNKINMIS